MKRLLLGSLSVALLVTALAPAAQAQSTNSPSQTSPGSQQNQTPTPDIQQSPQTTPGTPGDTPFNQQDPLQQQPSQQPSTNPSGQPSFGANTFEPNPFQLVGLARGGYLRDQGIPSYATLVQQYRTRRISARDVVQAAVNSGRLASSRLEDSAYIYGVDRQLWGLYQADRDRDRGGESDGGNGNGDGGGDNGGGDNGGNSGRGGD